MAAADFSCSFDLPMAKRPRLSPERSACLLLDEQITSSAETQQATSQASSQSLTSDQQQVTSSTHTEFEIVCPSCMSNPCGCADCNFVDGPASSSAALTPTSLVPDESSRDQQAQDADEDSCAASDVSDLLEASGEQKWVKPASGPVRWIQRQIEKGSLTPRQVVEHLLPNTSISPDYDNMTLWRLIVGMLSQPPKRKRLSHVRTIDDVVSLIRNSNKIIVLTGAGVSVSCGIPDFRSRDGIYARLSAEFPSLPDPQSMFDIHFFRSDPRPFFKFAKEIYPGQFEPSPSHKFIRMIEEHGKLLRNYTQNIDTLEQVCGIKKVVNCHGSFSTATCTRCGLKVDADQIKDDIFNQRIPLCTRCPKSADMAIMKPDIVFFGEGLSDEFHNAMTLDKEECDLLLVMGSSLKVRPVALIPSAISPSVPQVLINREPLNHMNFDVELLGDCDIIVQELCNRLGSSWTGICNSSHQLHQVPFSEESVSSAPLIPRPIDCFASDSPSSTTTSDSKREFMQRRMERQSLADKLPEGSFFFIPPSRHVFRGAEVYGPPPLDSHDSTSDDDDYDDSDENNYNGENGHKETQLSNSDSEESGSSDSTSSNPTSVHVAHSPLVSSSELLQESSDYSNFVIEDD